MAASSLSNIHHHHPHANGMLPHDLVAATAQLQPVPMVASTSMASSSAGHVRGPSLGGGIDGGGAPSSSSGTSYHHHQAQHAQYQLQPSTSGSSSLHTYGSSSSNTHAHVMTPSSSSAYTAGNTTASDSTAPTTSASTSTNINPFAGLLCE